MRKIVLDIETQNTFRDVGKNDPTALDISLLVIYDYETEKYSCFLQKDFPKLWAILERADVIIGYNSDHFDIPLLNKYYPGDLTRIKSVDLLVDIQKSLGRRIRLDDVASATLGMGKSGSGLEAIEWWKNGEIDKIQKYCEQDVRVTKDIYEYAKKNSSLKFKDITGIREFPIDPSKWELQIKPASMNFTLPF